MNLDLLLDRKNWVKLLYVYRYNKQNEQFESSYDELEKKGKVFGFYHAYCQCEGWQLLVTEQITHIVDSGLYNRMDNLFIGALIKSSDENILKDIIKPFPKIRIAFCQADRTLFEYPTLMFLQKLAKNTDFYGFYFHTKGISWINNSEVYQVGNTWRLMSEYFMFDKFKIAIHALRSGYDVYGTNYQEIFNDSFRIIGGNFFWFNSVYVKGLYELKINKTDRNESEKWILSNTHNVYCPFWFSGNARNDSIPEELYKPSKKSRRILLSICIYFSRFNYLFRRLFGLKVNLINPNGIVK